MSVRATNIGYWDRWSWSPPIQRETSLGRTRHWACRIAEDVNSVIDHQTTTDAGNDGTGTRERQQNLGCEPEISTGAPVFRYW